MSVNLYLSVSIISHKGRLYLRFLGGDRPAVETSLLLSGRVRLIVLDERDAVERTNAVLATDMVPAGVLCVEGSTLAMLAGC
jgi:hypothetical protein